MKELSEIITQLEKYYFAKELELRNGSEFGNSHIQGKLKNIRTKIENLKTSINNVSSDHTLKTIIISSYTKDSTEIKLEIDNITL